MKKRFGWRISFFGVQDRAIENRGVPVVAQWKQIHLGTVRLWVRSLASLSGLRICRCRELRYRSQVWLRSHVACGSGVGQQLQLIRPLAWEPLYAMSVALRKDKRKKNIYIHTHTHIYIYKL